MNWYSHNKLAQIWELDYNPDEFESQLMAFYELEYKYSMLMSKPFHGVPQRRDNIARNIFNELYALANEIKIPVLATLEKWLSEHALLDPRLWASQRVRNSSQYEYMEYDNFDTESIKEMYQSMINEHIEYTDPNKILYNDKETLFNSEFMKMLQEAVSNIDSFPELKEFLSSFIPVYRDMLYGDLDEEGVEEFGQRMGAQFNSEEQARLYIENMDENNIDYHTMMDISGINDLDDFVKSVTNATAWQEVLEEFNREFVFSMWAAHWKDRGIEDTRKSIEQAYQMLNAASPKDIGNFTAAFSHALNIEHQTGSILTDYLEPETGSDGLKEFLTNLSNKTSSEIEVWNEQLREIGVEI